MSSIDLSDMRHRAPPPEPSKTAWVKWVVLAGLVIGGVVAWPKIKVMPARSKQGECKRVLAGLYAAEVAHHGSQRTFVTKAAESAAPSEPPTRYAFFLDANGTLVDGDKGRAPGPNDTGWGASKAKLEGRQLPSLANVLPLVTPGIRGACPECTMTIACAGQADDDPFVDVWSVSTETREFTNPRSGALVVAPAGVPYNHADDALN